MCKHCENAVVELEEVAEFEAMYIDCMECAYLSRYKDVSRGGKIFWEISIERAGWYEDCVHEESFHVTFCPWCGRKLEECA